MENRWGERSTHEIAENLFYLGEIPRVNDFEIMHPIGKQEQSGEWEDDFVLDDNHRLQETIEYMYNCNVEKIYPCHCVSLLAKAKMMEKLPVVEVGVGMTVSI